MLKTLAICGQILISNNNNGHLWYSSIYLEMASLIIFITVYLAFYLWSNWLKITVSTVLRWTYNGEIVTSSLSLKFPEGNSSQVIMTVERLEPSELTTTIATSLQGGNCKECITFHELYANCHSIPSLSDGGHRLHTWWIFHHLSKYVECEYINLHCWWHNYWARWEYFHHPHSKCSWTASK